MPIILSYLACGAGAGFLAGLLGIGGGLVVVPALIHIFMAGGATPDDLIMRLAMGTSLAGMIFTAGASALSHARRGALVPLVIKIMAPAAALGTLGGANLAAHLSAAGLKLFLACFLLVVAVQMLGDFYPPAGRRRPGPPVLAGAGLMIGGLSSLAGLGGGTLFVPFLRWCGADLRQAVGTSSALGWAIAAAGTVGYLASGWERPDLPRFCLGYINLPAAFSVGAAGLCFAPLGARLSHALPKETLRKIFAGFLFFLAGRFLWAL